LQEYENSRLDRKEQQQICCDENTPCVPKDNRKVINTNKKTMNVDTSNYNNNYVDSHKGENRHSKKIEETEELDNEHLKPDLKAKIKEELEKSHREQLTLLKENKQNIINFLFL
jgi:hypothetical protein